MATDPRTTPTEGAPSDPTGPRRDDRDAATPRPGTRLYRALTRTHPRSTARSGPIALAFVALAAASLVVSILSDEPVNLGALGPVMMVAFGIGELSQRPATIAAARVLGGLIFITFLILLPVAWPSP